MKNPHLEVGITIIAEIDISHCADTDAVKKKKEQCKENYYIISLSPVTKYSLASICICGEQHR